MRKRFYSNFCIVFCLVLVVFLSSAQNIYAGNSIINDSDGILFKTEFNLENLKPKGQLQFFIEPSEIVGIAEWNLKNSVEKYKNEDVVSLKAGSYDVEFSDVPFYSTPSDKNVSIAANVLNQVYVSYERMKGNLKVNIVPAGAVSSGAGWKLSTESEWKNSGESISIDTGNYTVEFKDIAGYTSPSAVPAVVFLNNETELTGTYSPLLGFLRVTILPAGASAGRWSVDGGSSWHSSGTTIEIPIGSYTVQFEDFNPSVWTPPSSAVVSVTNNNTTSYSGTYSESTGSLVVIIKPDYLRMGMNPSPGTNPYAMWTINNFSTKNIAHSSESASGTTMSVGSYSVKFTDVVGYSTPSPVATTITKGSKKIVYGTYVSNSSGVIVADGLFNPEAFGISASTPNARLNTGQMPSFGLNQDPTLIKMPFTFPFPIKYLYPTSVFNDKSTQKTLCFAVLTNGDVYSWGDNTSSRRLMGLGHANSVSGPQKITSLSNVKKLAVGDEFIIALCNNGDMYSWGKNDKGQLGHGITSVLPTNQNYYTQNTPKKLTFAWPSAYGVPTDVVAGADFAVVQLSINPTKLYSFGNNADGRAGLADTVNSTTPKLITTVGTTGKTFKQIAASRFNTFAVATDGSVFGCGARTTNGHDVQQTRLALIDSARLSGVNKIFTNSVSQTVYALKTNGELWAWGYNSYGQLGVAIVSPFTNATPAKINFVWPSPIKEISVGHRSTMIMLNNNNLYALGACNGGRTGMLYYNGIPANFIVPVKTTYSFPGTVKAFAMDLNFGGGPNGITSLFYVE